jgi:hypothetical protein
VIAAFLLLMPIAGVVVWAFFRFSPSGAPRHAVLRFNLAATVLALALAVAWSVRTYWVMSPTVDAPWWPVISLLGAFVVISSVLALAAAVRNLVLFRRSQGSSRQ